jgi:hypothetical protein
MMLLPLVRSGKMARPRASNWITLSKTKDPPALHSRVRFAIGFELPSDEAIMHDNVDRPAIAPV